MEDNFQSTSCELVKSLQMARLLWTGTSIWRRWLTQHTSHRIFPSPVNPAPSLLWEVSSWRRPVDRRRQMRSTKGEDSRVIVDWIFGVTSRISSQKRYKDKCERCPLSKITKLIIKVTLNRNSLGYSKYQKLTRWNTANDLVAPLARKSEKSEVPQGSTTTKARVEVKTAFQQRRAPSQASKENFSECVNSKEIVKLIM